MSKKVENFIRTVPSRPVTVSIPVNKTTGFSWEISFYDSELICRERSYRRHSGGLGGGGIQEFEIRSQQTGEFIIQFQLKRPWENDVREERIYHIIVSEQI